MSFCQFVISQKHKYFCMLSYGQSLQWQFTDATQNVFISFCITVWQCDDWGGGKFRH